ncbi:4-hydroxyphenylacetic acid hydroxylase [Actinobacillus pleuropneumoniae]|nr:4-hydroxyphenylacetic acid hydroxylase [Actinobacillus pleuropneumoniae]
MSCIPKPQEVPEFSQQFRNAMAHLSAAVSIVTTNGSAGKIGITVSSVCSVTDTPPTLLFCINQSSSVHDIIKQNGKVCINVLSHEQEEMAKHFACMMCSSMEERFAWDIWDEGLTDNRYYAVRFLPYKAILSIRIRGYAYDFYGGTETYRCNAEYRLSLFRSSI